MESKEKGSYRQIFKATGLFGGVQVIIILIGLFRGKITAVFLGTEGFGIYSLLNSPIALIISITGLGISFSAVRDLSKLHTENDTEKFTRTANIFRYWIIFTAILGVIVSVFFSPLISSLTFGNSLYTGSYILLSLMLFFTAISNGQLAYLRSIRELSTTAKATVFGPFLGLFITIPCYYYLKLDGIVPVMILTAFFTLLSSWYYYRKYAPKTVILSKSIIFNEGSEMVKLGLVMTIAGLLSQFVSYLVVIFISSKGGVKEVGLYNAGWTLTNQYVGLILAAMAVDYFPRLAAINTNNKIIKDVANQQGEIILLLLGPLLIGFLIFLPIIIKILYSKEFLDFIPMVQWIAIGMFFRAISWVVSFIPGAKADVKFFLFIEITGNLIIYVLTIIGYYKWNLEGVGIAFFLSYILYLIILLATTYKRYNFSFNYSLVKIIVIQLVLLMATFIFVRNSFFLVSYCASSIMFLISFFYSLKELHKRIDLKVVINRFLPKSKF